MKNKLILLALISALIMALSACGGGGSTSTSSPGDSSPIPPQSTDSPVDSSSSVPKDPVVAVDAEVGSISIMDEEVAVYDFKSLFTIFADGEQIEVTDDCITSTVLEQAGTYTVTCSYLNVSASVSVTVIGSNYELLLAKDEITLNISLAENYDYLSFFTASKNGNPLEITEDMITSSVKAEVGTYTYSVKIFNIIKTLTVNVTNAHDVVIYPAYSTVEIPLSEVENFDFASLFAVYSDGVAMPVLEEMLDLAAVKSAAVGDSVSVVLNFVHDSTEKSSSVTVNIVGEPAITVNSKNILTYPNGDIIDLTTLFEIKRGDESVPVTLDMISGTVNYQSVGENVITLTYGGQTYTATVTVERGAIVKPAKADTIFIKKGEDKLAYDFANDFSVVVNGIKYTSFARYFVNLDEVNFNEAGTYPLTVRIPYSNTAVGVGGATYTYAEATVTYIVKANVADIKIAEEKVTFTSGNGSFDPYKNLTLKINGKQQTIVTDPERASVISCYAEADLSHIDFTQTGEYTVTVKLFVDGPDAQPTEVSYILEVIGDIVITATDKVVFEGDQLYATELFSIVDGGEVVEVTADMITGAFNLFNAGSYTLTLEYKGVTQTARLVVFDDQLKGTYSTFMRTIAVEDEEDDEGYVTSGTAAVQISDLTVASATEITFNGRRLYIDYAIDHKTLYVHTGETAKTYYTVHYDDGVLVLNPVNEHKMSFSDYCRPIVFFNQNAWKLNVNYFTVNQYSNYVLGESTTYNGFSIDVGKVTSVSGEEMWYGIKVDLVARTSSDHIYEVEWGKVEVAPDFGQSVGKKTYMSLNGQHYSFTFSTVRVAKIDKEEGSNPYAGVNFTGKYNGESAVLKITSTGTYQLKSASLNLTYGMAELDDFPGSGLNAEDDTVLLYGFRERASGADKIFALKFQLDPTAKTFSVIEGDGLTGQYVCGKAYLFLDGYGRGYASFDTDSYYKYRFEYVYNGQLITIRFIDVDPDFAYETEGTLFMDALGNSLIVKTLGNSTFSGKNFDNMVITDGGIVRINSLQVNILSSAADTRQSFYDNITIITPDGELTGTDKTKLIDTRSVSFTAPGFYQFTITVPYGGKNVISYYSIQLISPVYDGSELVGAYKGVLNGEYVLTLDKYGMATLATDKITYTGNVLISGDSFGAFVKSDSGNITISGSVIDSGVLSLSFSGAITILDYFAKGNTVVAGTQGYSLRGISVDGEYKFYLATSPSSMGYAVTVTVNNGLALTDDGVVLTATKESGESVTFRVDSWGVEGKGITLIDGYQGDYVNGTDNLSVDGFGVVSFNGSAGVYKICTPTQIFVTVGSSYFVAELNGDGSYVVSNITFDNSMLAGKTFSCEYGAGADMSNLYTAVTTIKFGEDGSVSVSSTSTDYNEGYSEYLPDFTGRGTYLVEGDQVTVTVGGYEFVFKIPNVVNVYNLVLKSTTLPTDADGYFAPDTVFI